MTTRFQYIVDALQAAYADTTAQWFIGPEHVYRHTNWNRIVIYPTTSRIQNADMAAQGWDLEELNTQQAVGARDDILWARKVNVELGIWADSYAAAEDRLHAMLVALATVVGSSNLELDSLTERWIRSESKDVAAGGALVVLSFVATFYVLTADAEVVATDVPIGEGIPAGPIEQADITVTIENESASIDI